MCTLDLGLTLNACTEHSPAAAARAAAGPLNFILVSCVPGLVYLQLFALTPNLPREFDNSRH